MENIEKIISGTQKWVADIVVGLNFCPFAKKELINNTIDYVVVESENLEEAVAAIDACCQQLIQRSEIETTLVIFPYGYDHFDQYLDLLDAANGVLAVMGYEGTFQLASFHPDYCFEGAGEEDVENYTNRSPWPMLHLIREESMARALSVYKSPEEIPEINMDVAREKGLAFFKSFLTLVRG